MRSSNGTRWGLGCSSEWAGGRGCRTHAAAAPGCLGPWDMATPGRTWNVDAWPMRAAQAGDDGAGLGSPGKPGPGRLGGPEPGAGRPSRAGAPRILCWAIAPPGGPGPHPPGPRRAPHRPLDPRAPAASQGPEFRGCFHLQRNFPGPLGCYDAPTNLPEPAPAAHRCRPPRPVPPPAC